MNDRDIRHLKKAEAELTAAAGLDDMAMDQRTRNHVVYALEEVQDVIQECEND